MSPGLGTDILLAAEDDLAGIGTFLAGLGGPMFQERFPGSTSENFYRWKYYENPVGPAVVALAKVGSRIVSMAAAGRKRMFCDGETHLVYELGDFLTASDCRKQGLFSRLIELLCEETARRGAVLAYVRPNENSFPILTARLGFTEVRRLDSRRFVVPSAALARRTRLPAGLWHAIGTDWIAHRLALGGTRGDGTLQVERVDNFDGADHLWESARQGYRLALVRDRAYLDWRYAACPTPYHIFLARRAGNPTGCVVAFANRAEPLGFIADLFAAPDDHETVRSLLARCISQLVEDGARSICTWTLETSAESASHAALTRACRFRDPDRLHLAIRFLNPSWNVSLLPDRGWHIALGDFDGI